MAKRLGKLVIGDALEIPVLAPLQTQFGSKRILKVAAINHPAYPDNSVTLISDDFIPMMSNPENDGGIRTLCNLSARTRITYHPNESGNYECVANEAPTVPARIGYLTPFAGKKITLKCKASIDPDDEDEIEYVWEHRVDDNPFVRIGTTRETEITTVAPTSGAIYQARVKARDTFGNESAYTAGVMKTLIHVQGNMSINITAGSPAYAAITVAAAHDFPDSIKLFYDPQKLKFRNLMARNPVDYTTAAGELDCHFEKPIPYGKEYAGCLALAVFDTLQSGSTQLKLQ